jgi:cysteine desulfurase
MKRPIYLDYAATTPVAPQVSEAMLACMGIEGDFGNPASQHAYGFAAQQHVEQARETVADFINAQPEEIIWTSGATEANNLAIQGIAHQHHRQGRHIITGATEHKAVLQTVKMLAGQGFDVTIIIPDHDGVITPQALQAALRDDTILVSIMMVNNETGVIQDIAAMGAILAAHKAYFHVDAVQAGGKLPIDVKALDVDLLSLSAHKMYGPKGIGCLYVRQRPPVRLTPLCYGGGHEKKLRPGTVATHQVVGFGRAAELVCQQLTTDSAHAHKLNQLLIDGLCAIPQVQINALSAQRVPNIVNVMAQGIDGEALILACRDLAVSAGSACTSATFEPSHVLSAMGLTSMQAHSSIRISFGRWSTVAEIEQTIEVYRQAIIKLAHLAGD